MQINNIDVIVIGGGHAGIEAALISSFLGSSVAIITMDINAIARMSCNPAFGGLAKGQMVREIDVLGGVMAETTDFSGIQFTFTPKILFCKIQMFIYYCLNFLISSLNPLIQAFWISICIFFHN